MDEWFAMEDAQKWRDIFDFRSQKRSVFFLLSALQLRNEMSPERKLLNGISVLCYVVTWCQLVIYSYSTQWTNKVELSQLSPNLKFSWNKVWEYYGSANFQYSSIYGKSQKSPKISACILFEFQILLAITKIDITWDPSLWTTSKWNLIDFSKISTVEMVLPKRKNIEKSGDNGELRSLHFQLMTCENRVTSEYRRAHK